MNSSGEPPAYAKAPRWAAIVALSAAILGVPVARGGEWPQILGPDRSGIAKDEQIARQWPAGEPRTLWQYSVGEGFAGVAVAEGRLVVFHRVADDEVLEALDPNTGRRIWQSRFPTQYVSTIAPDSGPRCVPLIHRGFVYLLGAQGRLSCVSLERGQTKWSRDTQGDFEAPEGYFGAGSTPLVEGDKLLVNVGGRAGSVIVALSLDSCDTLWKATDEAASYSSPVAATIDGVRHVLFVTRLSVLSIDPVDGRVRFRFPFGQRGPTVNAANPVVMDRHVFLSASYGVGAALVEVRGAEATIVWRDRQELMSSQYMTSVYHQGVLYGIDGRADAGTCRLRALDPLKAKVYWTIEDYGMATIMLADEMLVIVKTTGELVLASASASGYRQAARAQLVDGTVRALPAIADGKLFVRNERTLKCVDLARHAH